MNMFKISEKSKIRLIIATPIAILFIFIIPTVSIVTAIASLALEFSFRGYMSNKYNDPSPALMMDFCQEINRGSKEIDGSKIDKTEYSCEVDKKNQIVFYRGLGNSLERCFWRKSEFVNMAFPRNWFYCGYPPKYIFDEDFFDKEDLIIKKGCDNELYYIFRPKKTGSSKIIQYFVDAYMVNCEYSHEHNITISE